MKEAIGQTNPTVKRVACHALWLLAAIFCAKAFVINPRLYIGKSAVPAETTDYLWSFLALALWALFAYTFGKRRLRPRWGEVLFGLLFGVVNYFGMTMFAYDSWAFVGTTVSYATVAFKCLGQAAAMIAALTLAADLLTPARRMSERGENAANGESAEMDAAVSAEDGAALRRTRGFGARLLRFYRERTVLCCALLFGLCWLPYLVSFYPGTVIYDMCVTVREFFGLEPMKTWHGVFITYVFGACIWLGRQLGSDNIGTLIYMLGQTVLLSFALGQCVRYLRRLGAGRGWQLAALAFFGITPIWGCYCMMIGKDTLYTASLLLYVLMTLELLRRRDTALSRPRELIGYGAVALLTCLWRNNGVYVVLPTALLTVLFVLRGKRRLTVGAPLAIALTAALLFQNVLVPAIGVIDNSSSGIYSIAFQQTARVVRGHRRALTDEEKTEIDAVLDLDKIGKVYEPWISDPVKDTFRQFGQGKDVEKAALTRYRQTWLSMLWKYPVEYLAAFIANNASYYAFNPMYSGVTYNQQAGLRFVFINYWEENPGELHTEQPDALNKPRAAMTALANRWRTLPILGLLYVLPVYTWLLIAAGISMAHQRRWRELIAFVPALLSFAVCLVSPVNDYLRYFLPIIAMTLPLPAFTKAGGSAREDGLNG